MSGTHSIDHSSARSLCLSCLNSTHTHGLGHVFANGARLCICCTRRLFLKGLDAELAERLLHSAANDNCPA